ncbi:MAG: hypothetical protein KF694_17740 [Mesorhizobium sp.]|nr:hypothetical protein [Mesorhizobium sp.]
MAAIAVAAGGAAAARDLPDGLSCRAQVVFNCGAGCEDNTMPADLSLHLKGGTGSFRRGSGCVEGALSVLPLEGQHDREGYIVFKLAGSAPTVFSVSGIVLPDGKSFAATSDEIGDMAGSCE